MPFNAIKMKKYLLKVVDIKIRSVAVIAAIIMLFTGMLASAQSVNVTVNVIPPYSPYYADYSGSNASKVLMVIQNTTASAVNIMLSGKLEGTTNGVLISTRDNFKPLTPITLGPFEVKQLNGTALKDVFDLNNPNVVGVDKGKLMLTSRLPEGDYSLCIKAVNYADGKLLSTPGTGCAYISVLYPNPPILMYPINTSIFATNPQFVGFGWFNPGTVPMGTQYKIEMDEMPDIKADPNQVLNATSFPMLSQTVSSVSYMYNVLNLQLVPGKKYAWRVTASDPTGKTEFKNNGVSTASYFIYGENTPIEKADLNKNANNLNVTAPSCDVAGIPSVTIGAYQNLEVSWLWREQLQSSIYFGKMDTMLVKHFTKLATAKGMVNLGKYDVEFERVTNYKHNKNTKSTLIYSVKAPLQKFVFNSFQALAQGFIVGEKYTVKITSYDDAGNVLDQAKSCEWMLNEALPMVRPRLNIAGRLVYGLDNGVTHGANRTSITMQLTKNEKLLVIDQQKDYVSVTTNGNGDFKAQLTQLASDTGKMYMLVRINSPYYKGLDKNVTVYQVPPITHVTANQKVQVNQDTLKLGEISTVAYTNTLTVYLKKGFPKFLSGQDYDALLGTNYDFNANLQIDNATIDTMSRVPDGTKVTLFRKVKAQDIPLYEADGIAVDEFKNNPNGRIKVAEAVSFGAAGGKSRVVFNKLLCNFQVGDEYFIQVDLPDTDITQKDELAAPPQLYTFKPVIKHYTQPYQNTVDYYIVSKKPPMAYVKGKVMYQWKSLPGVLHPYANQKVSVVLHYKAYGDSNGSPVGNCQTVEYMQFTKNAKGYPVFQPFDLGEQYQENVVGQGVTDANGNFNIAVFTMNKMGKVDNMAVLVSGGDCEVVTPKQADATKNLKVDVKDVIKNKADPVEKRGNVFEADGGQFYINDALNNLKQVDVKQATGEIGNIQGKIPGTGPDAGIDQADAPNAPENTAYLERYFTLEGIPNVLTLDKNAPNPATHFVVQPFQTIDLGIVVTQTPEISKYPIKVSAKGGNSGEVFSDAKLVIYRDDAASKPDFKPDGEGTFKHPFKSLINPAFAANDKKYKPVEWVIDVPLSLDPAFTADLGNMRLMKTDSYDDQYAIELTPNPDGAGGNFTPVFKYVSSMGSGLNIQVIPAQSRINGRVTNSVTSKGIPLVEVTLSKPGFPLPAERKVVTDENGYFEVNNKQFDDFTWTDGTKLSVKVDMPGYILYQKKDAYNMKAEGNKYYNDIELNPNKFLLFQSVDAVDGTNVPGYAMMGDSTIKSNDFFGNNYLLQIAGTLTDTLKVFPINPEYFDEKIGINPNVTKIGPIKMYKRLHRMTFHLSSPFVSINIKSFKIIINNNPAYVATYEQVNGNGNISFAFPNVSVNNYTVQVINIGGEGYVPQTFNIKNTETRTSVVYELKLALGATLSGTVTYNKQPVKNTRVYLDYKIQPEADYNEETSKGGTAYSLLEAKTNAFGKYTITGIPISSNFELVTVHAVLEANVPVGGGTKTATLSYQTPGTADFALTTFDGPTLNNIYGFPLSVEHIEKKPNGDYWVDGMVDLSKNNSPFKMLGSNDKIKVSGVVFVGKNVNGIMVYEPSRESIALDATASIKMKYLDQYNVLVESPNSNNGKVTPLTITKIDKGGGLNAYVSLTDNSFNYPSTYLSFQDAGTNKPIPFYLFDVNQRKYDGRHFIQPIYNTPAQKITYHLADAANDSLSFSFIGFPARANPAHSYIEPVSKKIHLDVTFRGPVPHSDQGYVKVNVKDLVLDGYTIEPNKGTDVITVDLQSWKLNIRDWTIDPKLGGISSKNSYISTGIVDIPVGNFNLRHDLCVIDSFKVDKISLGGGLLNLTNVIAENTHLVFDEACGSDHKGHWRFSAIGQGSKPAAIIPLPEVPNKIAATNLEVGYFQLVSFNNENIIGLSTPKNGMKMYNNNKFTFYPSSIVSGKGTYSLTGSANIDVPRIGDTPLNLIYTKNGTKTTMEAGDFKPITFEGKGYVQFKSDATALFKTDGYVTSITGKVVEPGKFNPIPCTLSFGAPITGDAEINYGTIKLKQGYALQMDGSNDKGAGPNDLALIIGAPETNGMAVDATKDWSTLKFSGVMSDPKSNGTENGAEAMSTKPTIFSFEVLGDLSVNTSEISMDQVDTPLGKMDLTYDFASHELRGALHMDQVEFGSYKFTGDIQSTMGPNGMLLLGAGSLNTGVLLAEGFGTFNIGLLFGNTNLTEQNINTVTAYSKAKNNICWLDENKNNFKGFFITGGYDIINMHEGFDIGIASVYFNAVLGVEASVGANFAKKNYMALIGAHGDVTAGLDAITGTSISGGLNAHITGVGTYSKQGFAVNGDAGVTVKFEVSQYIPLLGTQSIKASKGAMVLFGIGGGQKAHVDFSLGDDDNTIKCTNNVDN